MVRHDNIHNMTRYSHKGIADVIAVRVTESKAFDQSGNKACRGDGCIS